MKLTAVQSAALADVAAAQSAYKSAQATLKIELQRKLEEELSTLRTRRDAAAWRAHTLGVPKRRIGTDGLATSAPITYNSIIDAGRGILGGLVSEPVEEVAEPLYVGETGAVVCSNDPFEYVRPDVYAFTGQCDWQDWTEPDTVYVTWNEWRDGLDVLDGAYDTAACALLMGNRKVSAKLRERALGLLRGEG